MRYKKYVASFLLLALTTLAYTSYGQYYSASGARSLGMAGTSLLLNDEFGVFNNPATTHSSSLSLAGAYNSQYINLGLNDIRFALILPLSKLTTGAGVTYYGDNLYNQLEIKGVAAQQIGFAKLGIRASYLQYHLQNYGYKHTFSIDLGGSFTLSEQVSLGINIQNLTRSKIDKEATNKLSSIMQIGLSYHPVPKLRFDTQVDKNIDLPVSVSIGIEYLISNLLAIRTGFNPSNSIAALGFGFNYKNLKLDFGGQYQPQLGFSGGLSFVISRRKK